MSLLHEAADLKKFDVRMLERNLARGAVTQQEANQALQSLPDDAENAEYVSVESLANEGGNGSDGRSASEGGGSTHH